jgi:hypothetical protein
MTQVQAWIAIGFDVLIFLAIVYFNTIGRPK